MKELNTACVILEETKALAYSIYKSQDKEGDSKSAVSFIFDFHRQVLLKHHLFPIAPFAGIYTGEGDRSSCV